MDADFIIKHLGLKPHTGEGGFYRETYRSGEKYPFDGLPARYQTEKEFSSAIYYLITPDSFSRLHRIITDEIFHFYLGDPVIMLRLYPDGSGETVTLGTDLRAGHCPQCIVPGGTWQGLMLEKGGRWALMGTTVAPAFDFSDFELAVRQELIEKYPDYAYLIRIMTQQ